MTKTGARGRGQLLYPLVYVASLTLVALSSGVLAWVGNGHVVSAAVQVAMRADQAVVRSFVESNLTAEDLAGGLSSRAAVVGPLLSDLIRRHAYRDVVIVSPEQEAIVAAS